MVHAETRNDIYFGGVIPEAFIVVVHRLELVILLLVEIAHLSEDFWVWGHLGDQDVVPFECLPTHADQFVHVSDLVDNFVRVRNYSVKFLERL